MSSVLAQPSDMISNLPENAIETILMYLPTQDEPSAVPSDRTPTSSTSGEAGVPRQRSAETEARQVSPIGRTINLIERARERASIRQAGMLSSSTSRGRGRAAPRGRGGRAAGGGRGQAPSEQDHQEMPSVLAQPSDMISNLPENVIETILMYLPTRDAVRTSILARKWRHRWAKVPQLIIDEMLWNKLSVKHSARITITMILYQLLLPHEGPINKFSLSIPGFESFPEIDNLILFLSRNGIEDLTLKMQTDGCYRLPSSFFTCQQLMHLSLHSCFIETTPSFKGFNRLITLVLCNVAITGEMLRSLTSSSPVLELLELEISSDYHDIEIDAPNLKTFRFRGIMKSIFFKKAPLLASVSIELDTSPRRTNFRKTGTCKLVEFFNGLPVLENLHLNYHLIEPLTAGEVPRRLLTTLVYLKDLKLSEISLNLLHELSFILCLIRNSPNLKHIDIEFLAATADDPNAVLEFLEVQDYSDVTLNELKEVKLQDVIGIRPELELIQLLLAKSPNLKKLTIQNEEQTADKGFKILKEVTRFRRASKEAEVIYANREKNQV